MWGVITGQLRFGTRCDTLFECIGCGPARQTNSTLRHNTYLIMLDTRLQLLVYTIINKHIKAQTKEAGSVFENLKYITTKVA